MSHSAISAVNAGKELTKEQERELHDNYARLHQISTKVYLDEMDPYKTCYSYYYFQEKGVLSIGEHLEELLKPLPQNAVKMSIQPQFINEVVNFPGMLLNFQIKYKHGFNPKADKEEKYIKAKFYVKELWPHDFEDETTNLYIDTFEGAYEFELVKFDYYLDELTGPFCDLVLMPYFKSQINKINKLIRDNKMKANQLSMIMKYFLARFTFFVKEYPYEPERLRRILTTA
jgi:hypothetical protein